MIKALARTLPPVLCALVLVTGGCSHLSKKSTQVTLRITDGCNITIQGMSHEQAAEFTRTWQVSPNCTLTTTTEMDDSKD